MTHQSGGCQAIFTLVFIIQRQLSFIIILVYRTNLQCSKDVILVGTDKFVGRHHIVILIRQSQGVLWELSSQIFFFIERIFHLTEILHSLILKTISHITLQENLRMKIGRGLRRSSQTESIHIVAGYHSIERTHIYLTWIAGFYITFDQSLQANHDVFESLNLGQIINKVIHIAFRLGQIGFSTVLVPEIIIFHHRIGLLDFPSFALEYVIRDFLEFILRIAGNPPNHKPSTEEVHFAQHIIRLLNPFSAWQSTKFLCNFHTFHKVHISFCG